MKNVEVFVSSINCLNFTRVVAMAEYSVKNTGKVSTLALRLKNFYEHSKEAFGNLIFQTLLSRLKLSFWTMDEQLRIWESIKS